MPPADARASSSKTSRGSMLKVDGESRRRASSFMIHSSVLAPAGASSAWRRRMTRPSRDVMVPSSSAHWVTGSTTSASAAVSERKKSQTTSRSRRASPSRTRLTFGAETTTFDPCTSRARMPSGWPRVSSSSTAGSPGPGMIDSSTPQTAATWRAAGRVGDLAVAGKLVALLAVLAAALAVALPGQRAVAGAWTARQPEDEG